MPLHRALSPPDIVLDAPLRSVAALHALVAAHAARGDAALAERILRRLGLPGRRGRVALGRGVALPHASVIGMPRPRAVFVRLRTPLAMDAADGTPVQLVLALLVPSPAFQSDYDVLMHCTELLRRPAVAGPLRDATDVRAVHQLLVGAGVPA